MSTTAEEWNIHEYMVSNSSVTAMHVNGISCFCVFYVTGTIGFISTLLNFPHLVLGHLSLSCLIGQPPYGFVMSCDVNDICSLQTLPGFSQM